MTEQDEFLAGLAKRLRELRLFLGYQTAAIPDNGDVSNAPVCA